MKNLILIGILLIILIGCNPPVNEYVTKEYLTEEYLTEENYVNEYYNETVTGMKLKQAFPVVSSRGHITGKKNKDLDFADGIAYDENGFPADGIIHELDLSTLLGNKPGEIFLYCEWLDGAEDENFNCYFKPKGLNVDYFQVGIGFNRKVRLINLVTDENSKIEWYHDHALPFDGRIPTSDPDYHDYNAISFRIMIYYYETGGEINN
jgi:hypothetical protein